MDPLSLPVPPQLALRIGVTGHRAERLHDSDGQVTRSVATALTVVEESLAAIAAASNTDHAGRPMLRIVSPLADGADRIVARAGLERGYELQCPLPFPVAVYEQDFTSAASREEFRSMLARATAVLELDGVRESAASDAEAYERVGRVVLHQCDVLLAVWDGEDAMGRGGTAQIVGEALAMDIPVLWVPLDASGDVSLLRRPGHAEPLDAVEPMLRELLYVPTTREDRRAAAAWYRLPARRASWHALAPHRLLRRLLTAGAGELPAMVRQPTADASQAPLRDGWYVHDYERADRLAEHYAELYRSGFVLNFLLAALAVLMALIGFREETEWAVAVELVLIVTIIAITTAGWAGCWHAHWLHFRLLAEQFRQMRVLHPLGRVTPLFRIPAHASAVDPRRLWVGWLLRARVREQGMAAGSLDAPRRAALQRTLLAEIDGQIDYHRAAAHRLHVVHERLHWLGLALFGVTAVACVVHIWGPHALNYWLTVIAAACPALGAALAAINTQGEFGRLSNQSANMHTTLERWREPLLTSHALTSDTIGEVAESAAGIMAADVLDWQSIVRDRPLTLPA